MRPEFENKNDLIILSEMQHYQNPTILIDFTKNFLFALFFAFYNNNFSQHTDGYTNIFIKQYDSLKYKLEIKKNEEE